MTGCRLDVEMHYPYKASIYIHILAFCDSNYCT